MSRAAPRRVTTPRATALVLALVALVGGAGAAAADEALVLGAGAKLRVERVRRRAVPTLLTDVAPGYTTTATPVPGQPALAMQRYDFTQPPPAGWVGRFDRVLGETIVCIGCPGAHVDEMHGGIHVQREGLAFLRRVATMLAPGGRALLTATKSQVPGKAHRPIPGPLKDAHPAAWTAWRAHARALRRDGLGVTVSAKFGRIAIARAR